MSVGLDIPVPEIRRPDRFDQSCAAWADLRNFNVPLYETRRLPLA
jgi:hypothetical protein